MIAHVIAFHKSIEFSGEFVVDIAITIAIPKLTDSSDRYVCVVSVLDVAINSHDLG
jgi:hypothetical protein